MRKDLTGSSLPAYCMGLTPRSSLMVGVGISGRSAVELIVAGVALEAGLFLRPTPATISVDILLSSIVIMTIVTTVLTLRWLVSSRAWADPQSYKNKNLFAGLSPAVMLSHRSTLCACLHGVALCT